MGKKDEKIEDMNEVSKMLGSKSNNIKTEDKESEQPEKNYDSQLKWVVFGAIFLFIVLIFFYFVYTSSTTFKYNGKDFTKTKVGNLVFYKVSFPLSSVTGQHVADYNLYLRNDPRKIAHINFTGNVNLGSQILITSKEDFVCDDNSIALANFVQYFQGVERKPVNSMANATCAQMKAGVTLINIVNSTQNSIEQTANNCYTLNVNNCAILNVTERFIDEDISKS